MTEDLYADMEIAPCDVDELIRRGEKFLFVDVRERWEFETSHIEGATLIPLREIPGHLSKFEDADQVILFCHHGIRSLDAVAWLRSQGVESARSMAGGIDRWAAEIDPSVPRY